MWDFLFFGIAEESDPQICSSHSGDNGRTKPSPAVESDPQIRLSHNRDNARTKASVGQQWDPEICSGRSRGNARTKPSPAEESDPQICPSLSRDNAQICRAREVARMTSHAGRGTHDTSRTTRHAWPRHGHAKFQVWDTCGITPPTSNLQEDGFKRRACDPPMLPNSHHRLLST